MKAANDSGSRLRSRSKARGKSAFVEIIMT
jgi:hypothetical protein